MDAAARPAAASSRREFRAAAHPAAVAPNSTAAATWQPGSILRIFIGNGTADNPNAGVLLGNGYSWDALSCTGTAACDGGNGGLLGNGGDGYNGGNGGSAGWFGHGGDGGTGVSDVLNAGDGGDGGNGGLFTGSGGSGGGGGIAFGDNGIGGDGGGGGHTGLLSVAGRGGDGGDGGAGGAGGTGGDGGKGGAGSWVLGEGGDGGDGDGSGAAGVPGNAGRARILFLISNNGTDGSVTVLDNSLVYFIDDTTQTANTPTAYGVIGEFDAPTRAALTANGRVVGESVALKNQDPSIGYNMWPLISDLFTSSDPVPDNAKLALAQTILSRVMANPAPPTPGSEFPSPAEGTPTGAGGYVFWAQDFEFNPGKAPTDEVYAGVLAVMWAGKEVLGDSVQILPVPSSSLFKTLGSATDGAYDASHIINGDGTTPYLTSLGLTDIPTTNPAPGSNGEWNFLSLAYANGLIDGFIGQQYNAHSTGTVTGDTLNFYTADLPYALMSSYDGQVDSGGPWNTDYYGTIPFHAGVYWDGDVDPTWGQPPSTNQELKPTPVPLPT